MSDNPKMLVFADYNPHSPENRSNKTYIPIDSIQTISFFEENSYKDEKTYRIIDVMVGGSYKSFHAGDFVISDYFDVLAKGDLITTSNTEQLYFRPSKLI